MRPSNALLAGTMARLHRNYLDILRRRITELRRFADRCRSGDITPGDIEEIRLRVRNLASSGAVYGYINVSEAARPLDQALHRPAPAKTLAKYVFDLIEACELTLAASESSPQIEKFPHFKPPAREARGPLPILLTIDDDPAIHDLVQAMFIDYVHIVSVYSSDEALDAARRHCPDLILLDNFMPGSSGMEFLEKLNAGKDCAAIPIIMLTADERPQEIMRATTAGVTDYITKPFDPHILGERISSLLKRARTTVLVANDNALIRDLVAAKLRRQGFHVLETADGKKALEMAFEQQPELIVLHQSIAGMDSRAVLHALRADKRTRFTPMLYLAADTRGETMLETLNTDASEDNIIPFVPEKVTAHVLNALGLETARA